MITKAEMLHNLETLDVDTTALTRRAISDSEFRTCYWLIIQARVKLDHIDEPEFAHEIMADLFGMLACPYCKAHLFPNPPEDDNENTQGKIEA